MDPSNQIPLERLFRLDGKVAVVTGGAKGIGRGIANRFAEAGAAVVVADIDGVAAEQTAAAVRAGRGRAIAVVCDVSDEASVRAALQATLAAYQRVDVLVNNAGIYPVKAASHLTAAEWDGVQRVNLRGAFLWSREFAGQVTKQGEGGVIINIGSIDSFHPSSVGLAAYDASKGGMLMLTRALALEFAAHKLRVNLIAPGGVTTEGTQAGLTGLTREQMDGMLSESVRRIPLGRMGVPDDIAAVALFLASPASAYMTGASVIVDGGRLLT